MICYYKIIGLLLRGNPISYGRLDRILLDIQEQEENPISKYDKQHNNKLNNNKISYNNNKNNKINVNNTHNPHISHNNKSKK